MPRVRQSAPTPKQAALLAYLVGFVERHGYQPSRREMAAHFGVTAGAVQKRLEGLARRGLVALTRRDRAVGLPLFSFVRHANP